MLKSLLQNSCATMYTCLLFYVLWHKFKCLHERRWENVQKALHKEEMAMEKNSGWRGRRAGVEIMSESVMVCVRCKSHRPPLSVIVQTFEVEPFSVRETRHLQRKWKECAILKEQFTLKWNLNLCQSHLNSDFEMRISFYQK